MTARGVDVGARGSRSVTVPFTTESDRAREAGRVVRHLRSGGLILYPTETVYGLGCMLEPAALDRLAALKGREGDRPFLLLVDSPGRLERVHWTRAGRRLADAFWPGPLTIVLRAEAGAYPARVTGAGGTIAARVSPHPAVRAILAEWSAPITSTSANLGGESPVRDSDGAGRLMDALGEPPDLWLVDGGTLPASPPSTIVDATRDVPRVLRAGAIATATLRTVVGEIHG